MGLLEKNRTKIAVVEETTEGVYEAPTLSTQYIQPLSDGFESTFEREEVSRDIITTELGKAKSKQGEKTATSSVPCELRASGVEGEEPDFDLLLQSLMPSRRQTATRITTGTGHTTTQLNVSDADVLTMEVGDSFVLLDAGNHTVHVITEKDTTPAAANFTILPALSVAAPDNVEMSKCTTYFTSGSGHKSLSISMYLGDQKLQKSIGCRTVSMSLDNVSTGQIGSFNFSVEGLDGEEEIASAPQTPQFDEATPPCVLRACLFQDGNEIEINNFSLSMNNELAFKRATCSSSGKDASRVIGREITGTIDPFASDVDVDQFNKLENGTDYSLFFSVYNPSDVAGEIELGSVVAFYLPQCVTVSKPVGDIDGILVDNIDFQCHGGDAGDKTEIYISMI